MSDRPVYGVVGGWWAGYYYMHADSIKNIKLKINAKREGVTDSPLFGLSFVMECLVEDRGEITTNNNPSRGNSFLCSGIKFSSKKTTLFPVSLFLCCVCVCYSWKKRNAGKTMRVF